MLDDEELVGALEELVDRRAHRLLDDLDEVLRVEPELGAEVEGPAAALVVRGERDELEDPLDVGAGEAGLAEALGRLVADEPLRARARVDAGRLDADEPPRRRPRGGRDPEERDELLRPEPGDRRRALDRVARRDPAPRPGARPGARRCGARCARRAARRGASRRSRARRSPPRRAPGSATCARPSGRDRGRRSSRSRPRRARRCPPCCMRTAFCTPVTPARESPSCTSGTDAWRSAVAVTLRSTRRNVAPRDMTNDRQYAELVSVACHDILTPLATVYGFARTLERVELEPPSDRYVEMIGAASSQIDDLVDQLTARHAHPARPLQACAGRDRLTGARARRRRAARGGARRGLGRRVGRTRRPRPDVARARSARPRDGPLRRPRHGHHAGRRACVHGRTALPPGRAGRARRGAPGARRSRRRHARARARGDPRGARRDACDPVSASGS